MHFYLNNILYLSALLCTISFSFVSCDRSYSNFLTEAADSPELRALSSEYEINLYADSIDALLPFCKVERSMVYSLGDYSFHVNKYSYKGQAVLYREWGSSGEYGSTDKRYYIKDQNVSFLVENSYTPTASKPYSFLKAYFKDGGVFHAKQVNALTKQALSDQDFEDVEYTGFKPANITLFEDALSQQGKFDLTFERIIECSKAKYLIFSNNGCNSYRAPVKVENTDEFIQEIASNPLRYKGEKLDIVWGLSDSNEVIYTNGKLKKRD